MDKDLKLSFRQKNTSVCPICSFEFHREELFSGGGRLIAGKLTDELRRNFEVSKKYGKVYPLAYVLTVCPSCYYSAYPKDFEALEVSEVDKIRELTAARKNAINKFFGGLDFNTDRDLKTGAASYLLAVDCYSYRNKKVAPTFKIANSSIRAAWLFTDLSKEKPESSYDKIAAFFYKKAFQSYVKLIDIMQTGAEPVDAVGNMGPDVDKNWGFEGLLYLTAVLTVKIGSREPDLQTRLAHFEKCKRYLSRLFGSGRTSKSKPSELLDKTKDLYDKINAMIDEWNKEVQDQQPGQEE
ncbi:MAG TPA: DUF2225 domain-containing protein [Spirochaetota bacterium]|nr:DUF2225 domain-containing protein [Spirochaetota bacterium]HOD13518.1 DUF2225 domain-containing protein [Spirochaetota bacterium]HPG51173.1 DUF2225 domain-containing protein [Spirochaetota bacterium]HPN13276.1 DUF2225 domain-containing protein [Spirochaetota bacterium]HQL82969.1 DUF2225 domain-containing protein [Spirochaetota bacterium]